ncbi:hypothetical protein LTR22_001469 [Elasticomyces elasticus]|nr:hypothetical protein LTR22_001469 [Elasticomyces elasticus]
MAGDALVIAADLMAAAHAFTGEHAQEQRDTIVELYGAIKADRKEAATAKEEAKKAAKIVAGQNNGTSDELELLREQHTLALEAAKTHSEEARTAIQEIATVNEQAKTAAAEIIRLRAERDQARRDVFAEREKIGRLKWEAGRLRRERDGLRQEVHALRQQNSSGSTTSEPTRVLEMPVREIAIAQASATMAPTTASRLTTAEAQTVIHQYPKGKTLDWLAGPNLPSSGVHPPSTKANPRGPQRSVKMQAWARQRANAASVTNAALLATEPYGATTALLTTIRHVYTVFAKFRSASQLSVSVCISVNGIL